MILRPIQNCLCSNEIIFSDVFSFKTDEGFVHERKSNSQNCTSKGNYRMVILQPTLNSLYGHVTHTPLSSTVPLGCHKHSSELNAIVAFRPINNKHELHMYIAPISIKWRSASRSSQEMSYGLSIYDDKKSSQKVACRRYFNVSIFQ